MTRLPDTVEAVDRELANIARYRAANPESAAVAVVRLRSRVDDLLDWRLELTREDVAS